MDLSLDETQQMLKNSARDFLSRECAPEVVRAMEKDERGYSTDLWDQMVTLGWTGLPFPEEHGGTAASFLDLAVLVEEMGRALAPVPFLSTIVLGGLTVMEAGNDDQRRQIIPDICRGQAILTLAVLEESASYSPNGIRLEAQEQGAGFILNGTKKFVPDGQIADLLIAAARTSQGTNPQEGITLFLVPTASQGVEVTPNLTIASDRQASVTFTNVSVPASSVLGQVGGGWPVLNNALQRAAVAKCVEMAGGSDAVLEMTVEYVKNRVQFGRPVGSFQAVQHHCANMATDVEGIRLVALQAAWRISEGEDAAQEVALAKAWVSDAYQRVCATAHQCHGAIGFTQEHNLQLYTRRARMQETAYGDGYYHRELMAQSLGL